MKYTIEFELPDNDTILNERIIMVEWAYAGYRGICRAKPKTKYPKQEKGVMPMKTIDTMKSISEIKIPQLLRP